MLKMLCETKYLKIKEFFFSSCCIKYAGFWACNFTRKGILLRNFLQFATFSTALTKMKFSIKDFSGKYDQIRRKLRLWSHLLEKSLMENFIFCVVYTWVCRNFVVLTQKSRKVSSLSFLAESNISELLT